jgi:AcrR family transcriptional regulator
MAERERRVRRTPAQAREEILQAARARLLAQGIEGLKIADVARDVDMSHATLLHHFGSSEGMRAALVTRMGGELLAELLAMLDGSPLQAERRDAWLAKTFTTLADPRHGQLFAWLALQPLVGADAATPGEPPGIGPPAELFAELLRRMQMVMPMAQAQFIVTLVVTSAIGLGVSRGWLGEMGLPNDDAAINRFVSQLGRLLPAPRAAEGQAKDG